VTNFHRLNNATTLPPDFFSEISTIPEDEAMELAVRLFMMEECRNIWTADLEKLKLRQYPGPGQNTQYSRADNNYQCDYAEKPLAEPAKGDHACHSPDE
jgi:hypothetical protein